MNKATTEKLTKKVEWEIERRKMNDITPIPTFDELFKKEKEDLMKFFQEDLDFMNWQMKDNRDDLNVLPSIFYKKMDEHHPWFHADKTLQQSADWIVAFYNDVLEGDDKVALIDGQIVSVMEPLS